MRTAAVILLLLVAASPSQGYQYWNEVRHSALLPEQSVTIRVENLSGVGIENYILFADDGIVEMPMDPIRDGPSTLSQSVPGPVAETRYYGFRLLHGGEIDMMPVRAGDGVDLVPHDLTRLTTDPAGDELFGYVNLDLTDCRLGFSGTRFYSALRNAGGGFPTNQGFTFFGYLLGIADPSQPDPDTVFALMYTFEQAGIISPGLYKITGTGLGDLEKIGEVVIEQFPDENTLMMSCEFGDLLSDPDFVSWYDPTDPRLGVAGFTQRITLAGGADEADRTPGGRCHVRDLIIDPATNHLPVLRDFYIVGVSGNAFAQIEYQDQDGHCPVISEVVFDETTHLSMYPLTLDYGGPVIYRTDGGEEPLASGEWGFAVARFSDNISDVVEAVIEANDVGDPELVREGRVHVRAFPNPFSDGVLFDIAGTIVGPVRLDVFDVRGVRVARIDGGEQVQGIHQLGWDGWDDHGRPLPAGTYFYRLRTEHGEKVSSMQLVR